MARLLLLALLAGAALPARADHPIAGVISLLEKLEVETQQEGEAEAATYQKFNYWCKRSTRVLSRALKREEKTVESLSDQIGGLTADISATGEDITALQEQLATLDAQRRKAQALRSDEHGQYENEAANLDGTITATDEAIEVMEQENESVLLETGARQKARKAAVRRGPEDLLKLNPGASNPMKPKSKVFSSHGGGVIETFKGLEEGWSADKLSEEEQETNALNAYNLAKQARDTSIAAAVASKSEKEAIKSDKESELAQAQGAKAQQENMMHGDSATLDSTNQDCENKASEWAERTKIREGELQAMAMAKKILAKVSGVRNPDEHVVPTASLLMATSRIGQDSMEYAAGEVSLLQADGPTARAVGLLRVAAEAAHSKSLRKLAQEISTFDGNFDKVKAMIQKMVFRLEAEQKNEDKHKLWCDKEEEESTESQADKTDKKNELEKKASEMDASIRLLMKQITENNEKVSAIAEYQQTETELRDDNHRETLATIKDAKDAQSALTDAMSVLRDFYKDSGMVQKEPWEFLQLGNRRNVNLPESPATWDAGYTGTSDPKSGEEGILKILEQTMQKFSKMEADAKVADETDQKDYEQDMAARKVESDEAKMDTQMKTEKQTSLEGKLSGAMAALKHTSSELDAVDQYLKDLEQACGVGDSSYEIRKKSRADEIAALGKAQTILEVAFRAKAFLQK